MSVNVRPVTSVDAPALADLLNAVIRAGGTTALEDEFTPEALDQAYLTGPTVHCCHIAVDEGGEVAGFQTLGRKDGLPAYIGDIATFARVGGAQRGVGSALFSMTSECARRLGHSAINATIRADNAGGLAFYARQGFVDHGVTCGVPLSDGTPVDRVHKRYSLSEQGSRC